MRRENNSNRAILFAQSIQNAAYDRDMTLQEFCQELGMSMSLYYKHMNGDIKTVNPEWLNKMTEVTGQLRWKGFLISDEAEAFLIELEKTCAPSELICKYIDVLFDCNGKAELYKRGDGLWALHFIHKHIDEDLIYKAKKEDLIMKMNDLLRRGALNIEKTSDKRMHKETVRRYEVFRIYDNTLDMIQTDETAVKFAAKFYGERYIEYIYKLMSYHRASAYYSCIYSHFSYWAQI